MDAKRNNFANKQLCFVLGDFQVKRSTVLRLSFGKFVMLLHSVKPKI